MAATSRPRRRDGHFPAGRRTVAALALLAAGGTALGCGPAEPGGAGGQPPSAPTDRPETDPPTPAPPGDDGPVELTILSAGDVLPHGAVNGAAARPDGSYDFAPLMAGTAEWSGGADLALCSLEAPLAPPGEPVTAYPSFGAPAELVTGLADLGWDGCTTATNHALDRGLAGVTHTLDVLDAAGLGHVGTARSPAEAAAPQLYTLERGGRSVVVAHLAATTLINGGPAPPSAPWAVSTDPAALVDQARAARAAGADLVVASLHWGTEYVHAPTAEQTAIADRLAASGQVDLVLGNHSHVPQPVEELPGGPGGEGMWVAWSMGNFLSNQDAECCTMETATGTMTTATVVVPADGPARVSEAGWTAVTVDRAGGLRVYPLHELLAGPRPAPLTLDEETLAARAARVAEVMGTPERTTAPEPTGPEPVPVPRAGG
ncbi:CapA family protein [Georgenia sp. TF02-10]|uniref:CapA family protein n=1 Tax=Georgenia sp. TF02-10 TaxID=2917725 RepID=UPI001FA71BBD|nr:CapA family protein [Georgenia sp. TF02-10]UNX55932.1 CapA family protein [Georgenia sp. TF02-10]